MEIDKIRRMNLLAVIEEWGKGGQTRLAKILDRSPCQINQWLSPNPKRAIGSNMAREIESALNLPRGYLDILNSLSYGIDEELLVSSIKKAKELEIETGKSLTPEEMAEMVLVAYRVFSNKKGGG